MTRKRYNLGSRATISSRSLTEKKIAKGGAISPLWLTGFIDGEGSFIVTVYKNKNKVGWAIKPEFQISLHVRDKVLLEKIQNYFQIGNIFTNSKGRVSFRVQSPRDLEKICAHLDLYPLKTQKLSDYILFKKVLKIILNKEHLTISGLLKVVAIKASMNLGLSQSLQAAFQNIVPIPRPMPFIKNLTIEPEWVAGFSSAEGCFFINLFNSPGHKLKKGVQLEFSLTQHSRDVILMENLVEFFKCGNIQTYNDACYYRIGNLSGISENIVPLFKKYSILGEKSKDFSDFCEVLDMVKDKKHLTKEGLDEIQKIKAGMNTGRSKS